MKTLDSFFLRISQSIADWYQKWFGGDNFFLANIFLLLQWVCILAEIKLKMTKAENLGSVILDFSLEIVLTILVLPLYVWGHNSCRRNTHFKNPSVQTLQPIRILQFFLLAFVITKFLFLHFFGWDIRLHIITVKELARDNKLIFSWCTILQESLWALFVYFGSCTPKPPQQGKFGELLESLSPQKAQS